MVSRQGKRSPNQSNISIKQIAERILTSGQITRQDHIMLTSTMLGDFGLGDEERRQINQIFDFIQTGKLKLVDW